MKIRITSVMLIFITASFANKTAAHDADITGALSRLEDVLSAAGEDDFTPQDCYYLGRSLAARILASYPLDTGNRRMTVYLNLICGAAAVNSGAPDWYNGYHAAILDSPIVNAFSTPGGHIFISRGFLELADSEDMLAAIIAHEMAHIQLRHGIEIIKHQRFIGGMHDLGNTMTRAAANAGNVEERALLFQESLAEITETLLSNGYSQGQEFEADSHALTLLASAGYDPRSLIDLLQILARNQPGIGGFNSTHPDPAGRIAVMEKANFRAGDTRSFRRERFLSYTQFAMEPVENILE